MGQREREKVNNSIVPNEKINGFRVDPRLTLDAEALLVLDDEVLLVVLQLAQVVLCVLGQQPQLLKGLIYLLVLLRHAVHHAAHRRARLSITVTA